MTPETDHWKQLDSPTLKHWEPAGEAFQGIDGAPRDVSFDMGWGRLIFAHTFHDPETLAAAIAGEDENKRDVGLYIKDPHVMLSISPHQLFLDPSHTYRLNLDRDLEAPKTAGYRIREIRDAGDAEAMNRIYATRQMMPIDLQFVLDNRTNPALMHLVAEDVKSGEILGTATGVDHREAFGDPEAGSSFWCLAVSPQAPHPGIGRALVQEVAHLFTRRGLKHMDLSVMYDNEEAIGLYERMGFWRVPVFCLKRKNSFNEPLYIAPVANAEKLNPYAEIIVTEARRRGINVEVIDAENGYFSLSFGGRTIVCRESLTEMTSAVAMSRCDDKRVTIRLLREAGLKTPAQIEFEREEDALAFLATHRRVVVKPAQGEQGKGISVDVRTGGDLKAAVEAARKFCDKILIEQLFTGDDLRIIVINHEVVAAALRKPPVIAGTGALSIRDLIDKQSRRRMAATGGESRIPLDAETQRCVEQAGYSLDDILPEGETLTVRKTANLHTGGTIHDVTAALSPALCQAAIVAAHALNIPVTGLDFITPDVTGEAYVIIEANERPGLANHEPQPTAERFIDMLFPNTTAGRKTRGKRPPRRIHA